MPKIKNEDLLSLHYQIEKSEIEQNKLENLLNQKSIELKRNRASKFLLKILSSVLLMITITLILYFLYNVEGKKKNVKKTQELISFESEIKGLKNQLNELEKKQEDLDEIKALYLYRSLIKKDTVYSVQVQTFTDDKVAVLSEKYTNTKIYGDTSFLKFSLGIFETLKEAQQFRRFLIKSSIIKKHIFVISYKDGKRIRIENPF